jgi:hypothetical protein
MFKQIAHFFVLLASAFACASASAADDIGLDLPACYERVYDARHLAANPGQHVQSMRIRFYRHPDADTVSALMNLQFRQGSRRYREPAGATYVASFICMRERGQIMCGVECDGGQVSLRFTGRTPADMLLDASQGFVMTGACPEEGRDERFNPRPDDRAFRLRRIAADCPIRENAGR